MRRGYHANAAASTGHAVEVAEQYLIDIKCMMYYHANDFIYVCARVIYNSVISTDSVILYTLVIWL